MFHNRRVIVTRTARRVHENNRWDIVIVIVVLATVLLPTTGFAQIDTLGIDGFEGEFPGSFWLIDNSNAFSSANWGTNTARAQTGNWSVFCADPGDDAATVYRDSMYTVLQHHDLSLVGYDSAWVDFSVWLNTEEEIEIDGTTFRDIFYVFVRDESGDWYELYRQSGSRQFWEDIRLPLHQFVGQSGLILSFEFFSDISIVPPSPSGVWMDDFLLRAKTVPKADLEIHGLSVTPLELTWPPIITSCQYSITNQGPEPFGPEQVQVEFFVSLDDVFGNSDDTKVGDILAEWSFGVNETSPRQLLAGGLEGMVRLWPQSLSDGDYHIFARINYLQTATLDPNPNNNYARTPAPVAYTFAEQHSVTIETSPPGFPITIEGRAESTPQTFTVSDGDSFGLGIDEFHPGSTGVRDRFESWSDGGERVHTVTPLGDTTLTATLVREFLLTMQTNTDAGGAVTPAENGWYPAGGSFTISASPRTGYRFVDWVGEGPGSYSGTDNPATITMDGPITQTANFTVSPLVANYQGSVVETMVPQNRALRVSFAGGQAGVAGTVFHRAGGQQNFQSAQMFSPSPGTLEYVLTDGHFGIRGVEYYFEVDDGQTSLRLPGGDSVYVFRTQLSDVTIVTTVDQQYQMIGFPFLPSPATVTSIFDEIDDTSDDGWRFGRWNATTNSYDAFPRLSSAVRNHGYWLITKGAFTITSDGVSSVPNDLQGAQRFASIRLDQGWNQIANPFAFDVAASEVEFDSGVEQVFHEYVSSDGSYRMASTLRPFRGYWIYNDGTDNAAIRIPYEQSGGAVIADSDTDNESDESWSVSLAVSSGDRRDVDNRVGVRTDASDRYDAFDRSEPPVIGQHVSLAFELREENGKSRALTHDYRAAQMGAYAYDVVIHSNTGEPVTMTANLSGLPARLRAVLVNPHGSETFDLRASSDVTLPSLGTHGEARYTLLIGTDQELTSETNDTQSIPRQFSLSQNYPNPFNAGTVISYTLTESEHVDLSIYDVLGRHITTLVSKQTGPGVHQVEWNGRDARGQSVASGVYFYRLNAGVNSDVRKMMVVK